MTRYFTGLIASFLISMGLVVAANYAIDAKGLYRKDGGFPAAYVSALQASPYGLAWPKNEREVKLALAERTEADCIVVGSSHAYQIRRETFGPAGQDCRTLTNLAVASGSLEDLTILLAAVADHPSTRRVYIEVSNWTYKWGAGLLWTEYADHLRPARRKLGLPQGGEESRNDGRLDRLRNLVNLKYFLANLDYLRRNKGLKSAPIRPASDEAGSNLREDEPRMLPDGSYLYAPEAVALSPLPWNKVGNGSYQVKRPYWQAQAVEDFRGLIAALKSRGIAVSLLLTPYHPKVWDCASQQTCESMAEIDRLTQEIGRQTGVPVLGSHDPRTFGLGPNDFVDDMHVSAQGLARLR